IEIRKSRPGSQVLRVEADGPLVSLPPASVQILGCHPDDCLLSDFVCKLEEHVTNVGKRGGGCSGKSIELVSGRECTREISVSQLSARLHPQRELIVRISLERFRGEAYCVGPVLPLQAEVRQHGLGLTGG